jgi:hypothetical protein
VAPQRSIRARLAADPRRLLLAQRAITEHVAAGLAPDALCARTLATLGETLGWRFGAVWRPQAGSGMLRCAGFGAGHSSLSRLREMPMQTLKIDRAFLREVPENAEASAIVTAILRLARALGRTAVAEGVETEAQRRFLEEQRCPLLQGFLLARPMPARDVEALLAGRVRSAA